MSLVRLTDGVVDVKGLVFVGFVDERRGNWVRFKSTKSQAAPATVCEERVSNLPLTLFGGEGRGHVMRRKPGDLPG